MTGFQHKANMDLRPWKIGKGIQRLLGANLMERGGIVVYKAGDDAISLLPLRYLDDDSKDEVDFKIAPEVLHAGEPDETLAVDLIRLENYAEKQDISEVGIPSPALVKKTIVAAFNFVHD